VISPEVRNIKLKGHIRDGQGSAGLLLSWVTGGQRDEGAHSLPRLYKTVTLGTLLK